MKRNSSELGVGSSETRNNKYSPELGVRPDRIGAGGSEKKEAVRLRQKASGRKQ